MKFPMDARPIVVILAATVAQAAFAADEKIPAPEGWTVEPHYHAASGNNVAFGMTRADQPSITRVAQQRSGLFVETDLAGDVGWLRYSPDGAFLLVRHVLPAEDGQMHDVPQTSLLNATGEILWTKQDIRAFSFSATGEVIYAWQASDIWSKSSELEVYSLSGDSAYTVDVGFPIGAALVPGSGAQVIVAVGHSLICLSTPDSSTVWRVDLADADPPVASLVALGSGRFAAMEYYGFFKVLTEDGAVVFSYDPKALGDADPRRDPIEYAQYRPSAAPGKPGELVLFDGSSTAYRLLLDTGHLEPLSIDVSTPPGFTLRPSMTDGRVVLMGASEVRVRSPL